MLKYACVVGGIAFAASIVTAGELKNESPHNLDLVLLAEGESDPISYALFHVPSRRQHIDLVLILRNTGAKCVDLDGIDASRVSIVDDGGAIVKVFCVTGATTTAFGCITVMHVYVQGPLSDRRTYVFELKAKRDAVTPASFRTSHFRLECPTNMVRETKDYPSASDQRVSRPRNEGQAAGGTGERG
jgi:hypothetical protein